MDHTVQAKLTVDLSHSLLVSSCDATATEDDIHLLKRKLLGLGYVEPDEGSTHEDQHAEEDEGACAMSAMLRAARG